MRLVKMLGLAAAAVMAAMAFIGASSAMAAPEHPKIVLCTQLLLICELENWAGWLPKTKEHSPVPIHAETKTPPKLLTSIGTVECQKSLALLSLLNELAELIEGHLLGLNFEECKLGSTSCTVTVKAEELGGLSITPAETKLLANVKSIVLEGRNTNATVKCGSFINCKYSASEATELTAHSGDVIEKLLGEEKEVKGSLLLLAVKAPLAGSGFLCPKTAEWDAEYHAINLDEHLTLQGNLWIEL